MSLKSHIKSLMTINSLLTLLLICILFTVTFLASKHFLEPKAYDFMVRISDKDAASDDIVNVVIDDESLAKVGRWPWKRTLYADIFDYLENDCNAAAIAFDSIITTRSDKNEDKKFFNKIKKNNNLVAGIFFSKKLQKSNAELIQKFALNVVDHRSDEEFNNSKYYSTSNLIPEYINSVSSIGSVLVNPHDDGVIREVEPLFSFKDKFYPSLSLAAYIKATNDNEFLLSSNSLRSRHLDIPIKSNERITSLIKWYKPYQSGDLSSHKTYSAWQVLESFKSLKNAKKPILSTDTFKNKIVLIGATASALNDIKTTPLGVNYPGVDIQATYINNLLKNDFMHRSSMAVSILILIAVVVLSLLFIILLQPFHSLVAIFAIMLGYFQLSLYLYSKSYAIDVITPEIFIIASIALGYGYKYVAEGKKKNRIKQIMGKYISNELMDKIIENIDDVKLGGNRVNVTALFADIRNFTSISETLEPEELSVMLNEYFGEMVPIIEKHNGMINKFMGDAILGVFGAPIEDENHPQNAVRCAVEMIDRLDEIKAARIAAGKPVINIGIGISSGIAVAGNIGTENRLEYTIIGDTVNLASRIESKNRILNTNLLVSEATYEQVKDMVLAKKISSIEIKGITNLVDVYEIIKLSDKKK